MMRAYHQAMGGLFACSSYFFFSSRRRHTWWTGDWSSDVCSSDLVRDRHSRFRKPRKTVVAAVGKSLKPTQKQRTGGIDHHVEAEDGRFPAAHTFAIDSRPDPARGEDFRDIERDAG